MEFFLKVKSDVFEKVDGFCSQTKVWKQVEDCGVFLICKAAFVLLL